MHFIQQKMNDICNRHRCVFSPFFLAVNAPTVHFRPGLSNPGRICTTKKRRGGKGRGTEGREREVPSRKSWLCPCNILLFYFINVGKNGAGSDRWFTEAGYLVHGSLSYCIIDHGSRHGICIPRCQRHVLPSRLLLESLEPIRRCIAASHVRSRSRVEAWNAGYSRCATTGNAIIMPALQVST